MDTEQRLSGLKRLLSDLPRRLDTLERTMAVCDRAARLTTRQSDVLQRLDRLEGSVKQDQDSVLGPEARLVKELTDKGVTSFCFKRVPEQYYQEDLEVRRSCLQAASIQHLCKSLVFENPRLPAEHEHQEFRHYLVLVQYTAKFHGEKVKRYLHKQNGQLGIQYFRPRQAPPETSEKLTGYKSGSVTPVGLKTPMPLILSHEIDQLQPSYFWMGGGEQLLKLGMSVQEFKQAYAPYVVDCTY